MLEVLSLLWALTGCTQPSSPPGTALTHKEHGSPLISRRYSSHRCSWTCKYNALQLCSNLGLKPGTLPLPPQLHVLSLAERTNPSGFSSTTSTVVYPHLYGKRRAREPQGDLTSSQLWHQSKPSTCAAAVTAIAVHCIGMQCTSCTFGDSWDEDSAVLVVLTVSVHDPAPAAFTSCSLFESLICNEYLADLPGPALLPEDPLDRARARLLIDQVGQRCSQMFHAGPCRARTFAGS